MKEKKDQRELLTVEINGLPLEILTLNLNPTTKEALVTTAVGEDYFDNWEKYSLPSWEKYARKYDLGIVVMRNRLVGGVESQIKNAAWDKLLAPQAVGKFFPRIEKICLIDTDVVISFSAPNIFCFSKKGSYAVVSQERALPFPIEDVRARVEVFRRQFYSAGYPLNSILRASAEDAFRLQGLPSHNDYFCSGLILLDKSIFDDLATCHSSVGLDDALSSTAWEEPFVNDWIQSRSHSWMPYEFQAIWLFEMAWFFPHLYTSEKSLARNREVAEILASVLLNRHFLHFAGSWFESEAWKNDFSQSPLADDHFLGLMDQANNKPPKARSLGKILPPPRIE